MKITINKDVDLSFDDFRRLVGHKFKGFLDRDNMLEAEYTRLTGNKVTSKKEKRERKSDQDKVF